MTKKELIDAMDGLDDDAQIQIYCTSAEMSGGQYAYDVYTDDKVTGSDRQNEITIVAHF
ncbi:MAG: hypothetical protein IJR93_07775 [Treponema sp.]|jgi:hypothetical protein|nr:hypothetical protein [Treponema sp.]